MNRIVKVGCELCIKDMGTGDDETYIIINPGGGSNDMNEMSIASPIGSALLDRSEGEIVEVAVPSGTRKIKILKVSHLGKK
ncbi:GreA/GreB family elongation factor [bacterium]|nr:GreA/GreB family elongation factor [bacterium]MBU3929531.1 GreA/GreB family elongation factor [bacterium]MBU4122766.1 GreA/GreB family elongation factor [bacterium]